jgi:hypothetical protein
MDAEFVSDDIKRPLVMFSHGRGSNGTYYAWFAEFLATRAYVVATSITTAPTLTTRPSCTWRSTLATAARRQFGHHVPVE